MNRVIKLINPILSGWVNYFAVGNSSECFAFIKDWVEKKVRRHMLRARGRDGSKASFCARGGHDCLTPVSGLAG